MRLIDAMLAIPFLILAIALAAFLGPSLTNAMIAIGIAQIPIFARLTRGQVLAVKEEDYIEAASAVGNPHRRIVWRHIFPNAVPPILVQASLAAATAIIAEASLSFLGLGQQPPSPSWGSMLNTRAELHVAGAVDGVLAGNGNLQPGAVAEPVRRRPARRARPAQRMNRLAAALGHHPPRAVADGSGGDRLAGGGGPALPRPRCAHPLDPLSAAEIEATVALAARRRPCR